MTKCEVCRKQTDKCCSVCRAVFYCSAQHQEQDWFARHRNKCNDTTPSNDLQDFKIFQEKSSKVQEATRIFVSVFEERLRLRQKVINANKNAYTQQAASICQELLKVSAKTSELYEARLADPLLAGYGIEINEFVLRMDEWLDKVMAAQCYWNNGSENQTKSLVIEVGDLIEDYPLYMQAADCPPYKRLLSAVIDLAQTLNYDKTVEKMQAHFIKLIERFQGIWEQIYAYYNMGAWYAAKTYYQKAGWCFKHALDILTAHKITKEQNAQLIRADLFFNLAFCRKVNHEDQAKQAMEECYRARVQGIGKNSLEASDALFVLAQWAFQQESDLACVQYVQECLRVRKLNAPIHEAPLQQTTAFIKKIYQTKFKAKSNEMPDTARYFEEVITAEETIKQPFAKRLFQDHKDYVEFKCVMTIELANTFTSEQWELYGELTDLETTRMPKEEASRLILQSAFSLSLNQQQRDLFIKNNKIF